MQNVVKAAIVGFIEKEAKKRRLTTVAGKVRNSFTKR
jgi:hypothetical protein